VLTPRRSRHRQDTASDLGHPKRGSIPSVRLGVADRRVAIRTDRRISRVSGSCAADLVSGPLRNLFVKQAHTSCTRDGVRDAHHSAAVVSADGKWSVAAARGRVRRRCRGTSRSLSKRAVAGAGSGLSRARVGHSSDTRVAKSAYSPEITGLHEWARGELNHLTTPVNAGLRTVCWETRCWRGLPRGTARDDCALGWDMSHPSWRVDARAAPLPRWPCSGGVRGEGDGEVGVEGGGDAGEQWEGGHHPAGLQTG
jgi:hypothetical protein